MAAAPGRLPLLSCRLLLLLNCKLCVALCVLLQAACGGGGAGRGAVQLAQGADRQVPAAGRPGVCTVGACPSGLLGLRILLVGSLVRNLWHLCSCPPHAPEPLVQCNAAVKTKARLLSSRAGIPAGGAKLLASCVPMLRRYPRLGRSLFFQHVLNCRRLTSSCASLVLYLCLLQAPSLQPHSFTSHAESMVLGLVLYLCLLQVPPLRQRFPGTGPARIAGAARAGLCACG